MASLKLIFDAVSGQWDTAVAAIQAPIAKAATAAIHDAGAEGQTEGRAAIGHAGFSQKWQNALRVNFYPAGGKNSMDPAAYLYHKIPYAGVFENGATIAGSPLLWLPLSGVPNKIGALRMTPRNYIANIGPLHSINVPGKAPMLAAYIEGGIGGAGKITLGKLRAGGALGRLGVKGGRSQRGRHLISVPIFVGISAVKLRARFGLAAIFEKAAAGVPEKYLAQLAKG